MKRLFRFILIAVLLSAALYIGSRFFYQPSEPVEPAIPDIVETIDYEGSYTSKEDVALYLITYGELPHNFVTKKEARKLGWVPSKGNLQEVCEGCSIGGDYFTYREEEGLPYKKGRNYYECDIDYNGGTRNAKRIVFSDDGLIYYTGDHYKTFELLYGEP